MKTDEAWINAWLDPVAEGRSTMSQRAMSTIEKRGGLDAVVLAARERGIHLLELTNENGKAIVAASRTPLRVLC